MAPIVACPNAHAAAAPISGPELERRRQNAVATSNQLAKIAIGVLVLFGIYFAFSKGIIKANDAEVQCTGSFFGMSCSAKLTGYLPAKVCWTVELRCDGTSHQADACTEKMSPGSQESVLVKKFYPPIESVQSPCESARVLAVRID